MKIKVLAAIFVFSPACFAQQKDVNIHTSSTIGGQSRYEIVQSTLAARWTFKVDRVCGTIRQLVITKTDELTWEMMAILELPKCVADGKIRYQVFSSGLAARHTFLINTDTGKTWQIKSTKDTQGNELLMWFPFEN
jgi:hypothetical protein